VAPAPLRAPEPRARTVTERSIRRRWGRVKARVAASGPDRGRLGRLAEGPIGGASRRLDDVVVALLQGDRHLGEPRIAPRGPDEHDL
jgi:hypothetical protein